MAPQEVIRAAYKALSQKYHPDKNPGDEKAARIMAILNSAYGTLADPQRRKEHDEWIAAEEWEIEWLESTRHEEGGHKSRHDGPAHAWSDHGDEPRRVRSRLRRDWKWWLALGVCVLVGWIGGVLSADQPRLQAVLATALGHKGMTELAVPVPEPVRVEPLKIEPKADGKVPEFDSWTAGRSGAPEAHLGQPPVKVVALSQVVLPVAGLDCDSEAPTLVAPNGEAWPLQSGYIEGFPIGNKGDDMQLTLDNAANASAVFVKVYDLERKSNVRYAFVQAHGTLLVDKLATGHYEIRYQNIDLGADKSACERRRKTASK